MDQSQRSSTRLLDQKTTRSLDRALDAIYTAEIGGGLVVLFFLVYDAIVFRQPLFTPSLMGSVLFDGVAASTFSSVNMTAAAKYTAVHFAAFGLLGLGISYLVHHAEMRSRHPLLTIGLVFAILEGGFWLALTVALPGVLDRLGPLPIAAANLLAATGVALYYAFTHRPELWLRVKRAVHLA